MRQQKAEFIRRIEDRSASIGVVGMGYVGLPLAVEFANAGFRVIGYDVSKRIVDGITRGQSHIQDVPSSAVSELVAKGLLSATVEEDRLGDVDAIFIAVPTPLGKTRDPDMSYVLAAAETVRRQARFGTLVVLESTTYPGTTRDVLLPILTERGLSIGEDVFLAFSPERVDPGNPKYHTSNTPKVVGGITPACTEVASALYATCIQQIVPVSSPESAELVKLLENTFRSVNIGLVNEMSIICEKLNVDVWEVIDAAATKPFGFMKFTPGPGIGGHCIPLDPHYLAWKMRGLNYKTRFIDIASEINSEMPRLVVQKVSRALNEKKKALNGARVLILGVAYKRDIDDVRESPSLDIMRLLEGAGASVAYHDPYVYSFREDGREHHGIALTRESVSDADVVVIITDHSAVDYQFVVNNAQLIVDTRNATKGLVPSRPKVTPSYDPPAPRRRRDSGQTSLVSV